MDDFGIGDTNDPRVRVLWEREGREVRFTVAVEPAPSLPVGLPPGCEGPDGAA